MNIGVIADTHIPFEYKHYLSFCQQTFKEYKCTKIIHIGDLVDNHAISYHEVDCDGMSAEDEMKEADKHLKKWYKAFPKLKLCRGNHDRMVDRKGKTSNLPKRVFKKFRDIWGLPFDWEDDWSFKINGILFQHGSGYASKYSHIQCAYDQRMNVVIGHNHCVLGVDYLESEQNRIFGMSVGCGIDVKSYAMAYQRDFRRKPVKGCGVILENGKYPLPIPML
uniref:Putative calcineurin-like phosphoesterase n=1 Tax=viral metagenome TaxID=1070528 RepID=A0A6M3LIS1_9ZZZZ